MTAERKMLIALGFWIATVPGCDLIQDSSEFFFFASAGKNISWCFRQGFCKVLYSRKVATKF